MSFSTTSRRMPPELGNGSASNFPFTFPIRSDEELRALLLRRSTLEVTTLVLNTDYTVNGAGDSDGGSIDLIDDGQDWLDVDGNLDDDYELTLEGATTQDQTVGVKNARGITMPALEAALDKAAAIAQELQGYLDISVKLSPALSADGFDPTLPLDTTLEGDAPSVLVIKADRSGFAPLADSPTLADIAAAVASKDAAAQSATDADTARAAAVVAKTAAQAAQAAAEAAAASASASAGTPKRNSTYDATITGDLDGVNTDFVCDDTFAVGDEVVTVGVQTLNRDEHYTFDGTNLSLTAAPEADQNVTVRGKKVS